MRAPARDDRAAFRDAEVASSAAARKEGRLDKLGTFREIAGNAKAVIFDFDNVLVDSEPFHYRAYARVFGSKGHTLDPDEYWLEWTSKGAGAEGEISRHALPFDPAAIRAKKDPIYSSYCLSGAIPFFPEALRIIEGFRADGRVMAIASGSYAWDVRALLRGAGLEGLFRAIVGKDSVKKTKPDPETYIRALEALDIDAAESFAVEDAEKGVVAAHDAGMKVITIETDVTKGFDLGGSDLHLAGLGEFYGLMIEAGIGRSKGRGTT